MQLSNLFGCSGVRMLSIIQTNAKAEFRHAAETVPVSVSLSCLLFLSGLLFILSFLPTRATITGHSIHWPFLIQLHANTFTHMIHCTPFLLLPPSLSFSVTHKFRPPPPPPNKSLPLPSGTDPRAITRSHSLETIVKQLKHSGSIKFHHSRGGRRRLQKAYWQKALNETDRMAEFQTQENCNCRLITILHNP